MKNTLDKLFERVKENIKQNKWLIIVVLVSWIAIVFFTLNNYKSSLGYESDGNAKYENYVELTKDVEIVQEVKTYPNTKSIALKLATYARSNFGKVCITVTSKDGKTLYANKTINCFFTQDNAYVVVELSEVLSNKDILVKATSNSETGKSIALYYSEEDFFENKKLTINGEQQTGDLTLEMLFENEGLNGFSNSVIAWTTLAISLLILLLLLVNPKAEIMFSTMVLLFGLIFMVIITPYSAPDEGRHYESALEVSNMMFGEEPLSINYEYLNSDSFAAHENTMTAYLRFVRDIDEELDLSDDYKYMENNDVTNSYLGYYIPQAIGISIARLLNVNMLRTFYAGRLVNLLFYVLCIYLAIKKTPIHKLLFGILATFPLFIQQAASYSYDSYINGLIYVGIAYFLYFKYSNEPITTKDKIIAFIVSLLLVPAKVIYGIFSFLYWLVPTSRYGSKKSKIITCLLLTAPTFGYVIYNVLIRIIDPIKKMLNVYAMDLLNDTYDKIIERNEMDAVWKVSYFFEYPEETLFIYLKTIRYSIKKWFFESIGSALSGLTLEIPRLLFYSLLMLVMVSAFRKEDYVISIEMKVVFIIICVGIAFLVLTSMLTGWLSPYDGMIQGVQGRYFSPLLPYFFSIFGNKKITLPKKIDKYVILTQLILFYEVAIYALSYTFIN